MEVGINLLQNRNASRTMLYCGETTHLATSNYLETRRFQIALDKETFLI